MRNMVFYHWILPICLSKIKFKKITYMLKFDGCCVMNRSLINSFRSNSSVVLNLS